MHAYVNRRLGGLERSDPNREIVSFRSCVRAKLCARDSGTGVGLAEIEAVPSFPFSLLSVTRCQSPNAAWGNLA